MKILHKTLYCYNPKEFTPIYRNGKLDNKHAYIAYKARKAGKRLIAAPAHVKAVYDTVRVQ
jgi:hypothetical protein